MEVHPQMHRSQLVNLDKMCQRPGSGPFVRRGFSVRFDLVGWSEKFPTAGVCFHPIYSVIELSRLAVGSKELLIEKVNDSKLEKPVSKEFLPGSQGDCVLCP
jgi:hypothetical protein